jgi:hypothetical protein
MLRSRLRLNASRIEFFRAQNKQKMASQYSLLQKIKEIEADELAEKQGNRKPSEMNQFETVKLNFSKSLSSKQRAYCAIFGINVKLFPSDVLHPEIEKASIAVPHVSIPFSSFGIGYSLSSPLSAMPSLSSLAASFGAFGLLRGSVVAWNARAFSKEPAEHQNNHYSARIDQDPRTSGSSPYYEFSKSELTTVSIVSMSAGLTILGSLMSSIYFTPSLLVLPASFAALNFLPPAFSSSLAPWLYTIGAPIGLLCGGSAFSLFSPNQLIGLAGLTWAGSALSFSTFTSNNKSSLFSRFPLTSAIFSTSLFWLAGPFVGSLQRAFVILGVPASAGILSQAYTNRYRNTLNLPGTGKSKDFHGLYMLTMLLAFMSGRAYSTSGASSVVVFGDTTEEIKI